MPRRPDRHDVMPPPRLPAVAAPPPKGPKPPCPACLPPACRCRVAAMRARPSTAAPEPRQAPAQATARTRTAAPKKPMPFSLPALGNMPSPATAPPATFGRAPLLGVFRVAVSVGLRFRSGSGIAISMPPSACRQLRRWVAWCGVVVPVSPAACQQHAASSVPQAASLCCVVWCGWLLSLHALQGVDEVAFWVRWLCA